MMDYNKELLPILNAMSIEEWRTTSEIQAVLYSYGVYRFTVGMLHYRLNLLVRQRKVTFRTRPRKYGMALEWVKYT